MAMTHEAERPVMHHHQLEQVDTSAWFTPSVIPQRDDTDAVQLELHRRYAEALWLGEFHTSLDDFLDYSAGWTSLNTEDLVQVLVALSTLVSPRGRIRDRHGVGVLTAVREYASTSKLPDSHPHLSQYELGLLSNISRSGPAARVFGAGDTDRLVSQWSHAMESRELQLQILITLFLLQVASRQPKAVEEARDLLIGKKSSDDTAESATITEGAEAPALGTKRRRRKLDKPKRWQGPTLDGLSNTHGEDLVDEMKEFAWSRRSRKRHLTSLSQDDVTLNEDSEDVLEVRGGQVLDVDHLSKRLEALTDILCLSQVTAGMASELSDLLGESQTQDPSESVPNPDTAVYFGSSVRKIAQYDEMDDAQWLCANVVEPRFGSSLPRQCLLFRSKCFVALQSGTTPARPQRKQRKTTASIELPSAVSTKGLSHELEREQAGRIKMMRAKAVGTSSSLLGRGREVDMTRRLARSVSTGSGLLKFENTPFGDQTVLTDTSESQSQSRSFASILPPSQRPTKAPRKPAVTKRHSTVLAADSPEKATLTRDISSRLLVLSTPHKSRPASRDRSRLTLPGAKGLGVRSASFGGLFRRELSTGARSPSPIAFGSDLDD